MRKLLILFTLLALGVVGTAIAQDAPTGELELFSWWTGGGEAAGLDALIARFSEMYPDVTIVNSAVAGGSGVNARAVESVRLAWKTAAVSCAKAVAIWYVPRRSGRASVASTVACSGKTCGCPVRFDWNTANTASGGSAVWTSVEEAASASTRAAEGTGVRLNRNPAKSKIHKWRIPGTRADSM